MLNPSFAPNFVFHVVRLLTPLVLEILDVAIPSLIVTLRLFKAIGRTEFETFIRVWLAGLFFSLLWEITGIGFAWEYLNFTIYLYDGVALGPLFAWGWWFIICYGFSMVFIKKFKRMRYLFYFITGVIVGFVIETFAVGVGWWRYLFPFMKPRPEWSVFINGEQIHVVTYVGWGVITLFILLISTDFFVWLNTRVGRILGYIVLLLASTFIGLVSFYALALMYILLPWTVPY